MADSPTARITKLEQRVAVLEERLETLGREVLRYGVPALTQRSAVLESQVKDLREGKQEWARRAWAIVGPILGGGCRGDPHLHIQAVSELVTPPLAPRSPQTPATRPPPPSRAVPGIGVAGSGSGPGRP